MDDLLFNEGELRLAIEHQASQVRDEVEAVPEEHLLQADVDEWVAALVEEFRVEAPELQIDQIYRDPPQETRVDVSWDGGRYFSPTTTDRTVGGHRIVVHVPFTRDREVFRVRPNTFTYNPPRANVATSELRLTIEYPHDAPRDIDAHVNGTLGTVQQWLGWARAEIESFNQSLDQHIRGTIAARRTRIEERNAHLATSSIPERRPGDTTKTYIPEAIVSATRAGARERDLRAHPLDRAHAGPRDGTQPADVRADGRGGTP